MKRVVGILAVLGLLGTGCATPYASQGAMGGFSETQIAPDTFRVLFNGNGYTSRERSQDFVLLRAAELTLQNRFRYFAVIKEGESGSVTSFVNPGGPYMPTTINHVVKPGSGLLIQCFKEKPGTMRVLDAVFVVRSIGGKYQLENFHVDVEPTEAESEPAESPEGTPPTQTEAARKILNPPGVLPQGRGGAAGHY